MDTTSSSSAAVALLPKRSGITLCSPQVEPPSLRWCQPVAKGWHLEEDLENAKDLGLDHYEVRSVLGWYRHVTLVMRASAYLAGICVEEHALLLSATASPTKSLTLLVLPLTIPEVRHLLGHLIWPIPRNMPRALAWSRWRRCHQSRASYFHTKRRLKAG